MESAKRLIGEEPSVDLWELTVRRGAAEALAGNLHQDPSSTKIYCSMM
jgi:hypothetical protein